MLENIIAAFWGLLALFVVGTYLGDQPLGWDLMALIGYAACVVKQKTGDEAAARKITH
ncbi:hypothetical protein [Ottowia sp.]|jgi:hypothetical protein|uniref:hypothetical protein n=1 Tax=Ottowia sp. TaxID=1898956 RepID=UPI0025E0D425|nr:hypothetical protein [Ottowia sp.]MBK6612683.1 hypothetical protein [Ottowia sp.]MBK6748188.1 hypothetical protein [Ottowia sp.]